MELQIPCLLNMVTCMIEKKDFNRAILLCDSVMDFKLNKGLRIKIDNRNQKRLFQIIL